MESSFLALVFEGKKKICVMDLNMVKWVKDCFKLMIKLYQISQIFHKLTRKGWVMCMAFEIMGIPIL